ncbi:hypothetical protein BHM03_00006520 [Ensete ventricosum]|nr:hypothetical protein BHM03_00006520 [Ensete ventricosum]
MPTAIALALHRVLAQGLQLGKHSFNSTAPLRRRLHGSPRAVLRHHPHPLCDQQALTKRLQQPGLPPPYALV